MLKEAGKHSCGGIVIDGFAAAAAPQAQTGGIAVTNQFATKLRNRNYNATLLQDVTSLEEILQPSQNVARDDSPPCAAHLKKDVFMKPRNIAAALGSALLLSAATLAAAHEAHVHGVGKLDVALDGKTLSLHLDSPLVNLIGFEHAAKSAKDKQAAQDMAKTLRSGGAVFVTTPSAECKLSGVQLVSAAIEPALLGEAAVNKAAGHEDHDGHADLDADFTFQCAHPERLQRIDVKLFDAFKGFNSIDVQLVTAKRQGAAKLTPGSASLTVQ